LINTIYNGLCLNRSVNIPAATIPGLDDYARQTAIIGFVGSNYAGYYDMNIVV
jgi:hypothetical protein